MIPVEYKGHDWEVVITRVGAVKSWTCFKCLTLLDQTTDSSKPGFEFCLNNSNAWRSYYYRFPTCEELSMNEALE